ncbi:MAG: glycosyltransferase [Candidatus Solibacter usitatus]|nr:glycosyltransferase [Candidatus Solibacter usitatus]
MTKRNSDSPGAERARALFLTPEAPYPLEGGGALRAASLFEYLADRYAVDVIVFREPGAPDPALLFPAESARRIHVIDLPPHSGAPIARATRNAGRLLRGIPPMLDRFSGFGAQVSSFIRERTYAVAVIEHFWCAPYVEQVARAAKVTVLDLHNVESVLHARCSKNERLPMALAHRGFSRACLALEKKWLPRFDCLLAASPDDARRVDAIFPGARMQVYANAIPAIAQPERAEQDVIAFSGNFAYPPNVSGTRFLVSKIWPGLRAQWPELTLRLIGKNADAVRAMVKADPRIQLTGRVANAVEALAAAKVVVAPLLAGSGTRLKIIEAWAAGRAVVSTRIGAEGLPAHDGENILLADDPAKFAGAVSALLASPVERARLGQAGRALFELHFTWERVWETLDL